VTEDEMSFTRQADLRHAGQGHEIVVTLPYARLAGVDLESDLNPRFYEAYELVYGHAHRHLGLEITTCRLTASGPRPEVALKQMEAHGHPPETGGFVDTPLYDRSKLFAGATFSGPAIVEEIDSTAVIGPGTRVTIDAYANLVVEFDDT
jgi:N-methylhydantoinase A